MTDYLYTTLFRAIFIIPVAIVSLTFHEWGHATMAYRLGDPTAKNMGRLTLNPLKHLDPLGTLLMIFARFGWARPVPIDPRYFKNPRRDDLLVSIAGITMNCILFLVASLTLLSIYRWGYGISASDVLEFIQKHGMAPVLSNSSRVAAWGLTLLYFFASLNVVLMVFNLLPIPPLDGYHVLNDLILKRPLFADPRMMRIGFLGLIILVFVFPGVLGTFFNFFIDNLFAGVVWFFNLVTFA